MFNVFRAIKIHRDILTRSEKKQFLLLNIFSFIGSLFDVAGIGALGFFMLIMTNSSVLHNLPILGALLPKSWLPYHVLILLGGVILSAFVIKTILNCLLQKYLISFCFTIGTRIRMQLMERYLYAPYSYFISTHTTNMITHILNYVGIYSNMGLVSFMQFSVQLVFVLSIISSLFVYKPLVTAVLLVVFLGVFLIYSFIVKNKLYSAGEKINISSQDLAKSVQEGLMGIKEIRILSKESFILDRIRKASKINSDGYTTINIFQRLPLNLFESALFGFVITLCLVELSLHVSPQSIVALCGMLVAAGARLLPGLYIVVSSLGAMQGCQHTLESVHHVLFDLPGRDSEPSWRKNTCSINLDAEKNQFSSIVLDDLYYRYSETQNYAIKSISFEIKCGQSIGIIGASGAGKSTLIDILLGLLTPTKGKILIDGIAITDQRAWVSRFAYIPQSIYLLDASLKKNVTFGEDDALFDEPRFQNALIMAQLKEVVACMPDGVETIIGENGIRLSGGQRQRIALARAFYHERDIIVMDEATAALDSETEKEVVSAINSLHKLKTLIIIAHRHTTVASCDIIYRLDHGSIVESGSFEEVLGCSAKPSSISYLQQERDSLAYEQSVDGGV